MFSFPFTLFSASTPIDPNPQSGDLLISDDATPGTIYVMVGISNTLRTTLVVPGASLMRGVTVASGNLITLDALNKVRVHSGISINVNSSFNFGFVNPRGLDFDGTNLMSTSDGDNKRYLLSGIGNFPIASPLLPFYNSPRGIMWDGTLPWTADAANSTIAQFTWGSTIITSFPAQSSAVAGLVFDGANLIEGNRTLDTIFIHNGLNSGIASSFPIGSVAPQMTDMAIVP